jgi:hypothetical protein
MPSSWLLLLHVRSVLNNEVEVDIMWLLASAWCSPFRFLSYFGWMKSCCERNSLFPLYAGAWARARDSSRITTGDTLYGQFIPEALSSRALFWVSVFSSFFNTIRKVGSQASFWRCAVLHWTSSSYKGSFLCDHIRSVIFRTLVHNIVKTRLFIQ